MCPKMYNRPRYYVDELESPIVGSIVHTSKQIPNSFTPNICKWISTRLLLLLLLLFVRISSSREWARAASRPTWTTSSSKMKIRSLQCIQHPFPLLAFHWHWIRIFISRLVHRYRCFKAVAWFRPKATRERIIPQLQKVNVNGGTQRVNISTVQLQLYTPHCQLLLILFLLAPLFLFQSKIRLLQLYSCRFFPARSALFLGQIMIMQQLQYWTPRSL